MNSASLDTPFNFTTLNIPEDAAVNSQQTTGEQL